MKTQVLDFIEHFFVKSEYSFEYISEYEIICFKPINQTNLYIQIYQHSEFEIFDLVIFFSNNTIIEIKKHLYDNYSRISYLKTLPLSDIKCMNLFRGCDYFIIKIKEIVDSINEIRDSI